MKLRTCVALSAVVAVPALADETRQLEAHEHGVGQLDVAFEGGQIAMVLHAPGADIVGFEYEAVSDADVAAVEAAIAVLSDPAALFVLPQAAGCAVVMAEAALEAEDAHDEHEDHDDHGDDDHDEHGDDDHASAEAGHAEFHAEYLFDCADPSAVTEITFGYFEAFPNALEVEVQVISDAGATSFEVERDMPVLDLSGAL